MSEYSPEPCLTLPWREPADAFAALQDSAFALLLHGGDSASRLYAFPSVTLDEDVPAGGFDRLAATLLARLTQGEQVAGLLGYEFAAALEDLDQPRAADWRSVSLGAYPAWAVFPADRHAIEVYGVPGAARRLADALSGTDRADPRAVSGARWQARRTRPDYLAACDRILAHIRAGDIYQANLSQGFDVALGHDDDPWQAFTRLIERSRASHGGYFRLDEDRAILTNSPETFLTLSGGVLECCPIKGTRPRGTSAATDQALADDLRASEKDRAENLMIVDLMRHDLSRVCTPGSVAVPEFAALQSFANVHHLVSTVRGTLRPGLDALDVLAATFPAGSITGAPKIRAMEIIAQEEGEARGPYCGAMGWIGEGGAAMDFNVMIRTAALTRPSGSWQGAIRSGGAITIGSDPAAEFDETLAKMSALRGVFAE